MKCSEVMKRDVPTAHREDSVLSVAQTMAQRGVGFVPVLDRERRFVGGVTEHDLFVHVVASGRSSDTMKIANLVDEKFPTVGPDEDHGTAEQKMRESKSTRVAVVGSEGRYLGVVTLSALAETVGSQEAGNLLKELRRADI